MNCAVIIPLKQTTDQLIENIQSLLNKQFHLILVIQPHCVIDMRLMKIAQNNKQYVIFHKEDQRSSFLAIKNVLKLLHDQHQDIEAVIVLCHPHCSEDIERVAQALLLYENNVILGVRMDKCKDSSYQKGNHFATLLFNIIYGTRLRDIQSGLVAIPAKDLAYYSNHGHSFFKFDVYTLIQSKRQQNEIIQIPIQPLSIENKASRRTFKETFRTYLTIISGFIGYSFSTLVAAIVDITLFTLLSGVIFLDLPLKLRIFLATFISRIFSSLCDFSIDRKYVFGNKNNMRKAITKYYILWFTLLSVSSLLVYLSKQYMGSNLVIAKLLTDLLLGVISYQVQLRWVFKNTDL